MMTNEQNLDAYNKVAHIYAGDKSEEDDPGMRQACRDLFFSRLPGKTILEIGCRPGTDSHYLQRMGLEVTATDFSPEFVKIVKERYPTLTVHQMDMTQPDLPETSFDGIYDFACFMHLPRKFADQTLLRLRQLFKVDGILFLGMIKSTKVDEYVISNWCGVDNNPVLFTCYAEAEIESCLKKAGFEHVEFHAISSEVYETLPRLVESGVSIYEVIAKVGKFR